MHPSPFFPIQYPSACISIDISQRESSALILHLISLTFLPPAHHHDDKILPTCPTISLAFLHKLKLSRQILKCREQIHHVTA